LAFSAPGKIPESPDVLIAWRHQFVALFSRQRKRKYCEFDRKVYVSASGKEKK